MLTRSHPAGKILLPSAILQLWDLGGQRDIRTIWPRYYDDCHAVVYVIDADDCERLSEGWEVFGTHAGVRRSTPAHMHTDLPKIACCLHRRSSACRCFCSRTSRIAHTVCPSQRSGTTTRSGTNARWRAHGSASARRQILSTGANASQASTSWVCLRSRGMCCLIDNLCLRG